MLGLIRRGLAGVAVLLVAGQVAWAEEPEMQTAETRLFSLQVPAAWKLRSDGNGVLLAGGSRVVNGMPMPMPFLSAQYCAQEMSPQSVGLTPCSDSCEVAAQSMLNELGKTMTLDKMQSSRRGQTTEFRLQGKARSGQYAAAFALSCSPLGRAYVSLASDGPVEALRVQFGGIMQSLQWRNVPLPEK